MGGVYTFLRVSEGLEWRKEVTTDVKFIFTHERLFLALAFRARVTERVKEGSRVGAA